MPMRRGLINTVVYLVLASVLVGCGGGREPGSEVVATSGPSINSDPAPSATSPSPSADGSTSTTALRRVELPAEIPEWQAVVVTTTDGVDIQGRYWAGADPAVIVTHGYDTATTGPYGERPPQTSESVLIWSGVLAESGHSVLAIEWRGHGESSGDFSVKASQLDLKAAYDFLRDRGSARVAVLAFYSSGPTATDLAANDAELDLAGLGLVWTPPQMTTFDSTQALPDVDEPVWVVGIEQPTQHRWSRRLADKAANLYAWYIAPSVSEGGESWLVQDYAGMQNQYIDGPEFAGQMLDFIESL
jgi:pimeloyl-ACP methyl ester carboxylesterase